MSKASQQPSFPVVISNPPGLGTISYRVGDYTSFREALLQNLPGETELQGWRPTDNSGDLALQLLEWWAYLADILTFYNERIANNSYLGTAVQPAAAQAPPGTPAPGAPAPASSTAPGLPDSTTLIAGVTGFRTKPGIAATGQLAVLINAQTPVSLPANFAVQSKPGPGQQPQVFEAVASNVTYLPTNAGGAVPVDLSCATTFTTTGVTTKAEVNGAAITNNGPLLKGAISSIKTGDMVVVALVASSFANATSMAVTVQSVTTETDPRGRTNTRLGLSGTFVLPSQFTTGVSPDVTQCQVLRSIQSAALYTLEGAQAVNVLAPSASLSTPLGIHLASLVRDIAVGDLVVIEIVTAATPPAAPTTSYVTSAVVGYEETVWYANAPRSGHPDIPPKSDTTPPVTVAIPIPHSFITLESGVLNTLVSGDDILKSNVSVSKVWYGYRPVSELLDEMPPSSVSAGDLVNFIVQPGGVVSPNTPSPATVLLEGADGLGALATWTAASSSAPPSLKSSDHAQLALPLRVLFNVFNVTAGKTVVNEVLGDGDATVASQSFTLAKSPLTYLPNATNPGSPVSTLQVRVDGVSWAEVPDFQGQLPDARIFVTQEDKSQKTMVMFGDGVHGARLTTGTGNVLATYRYGSGPGDPSLGGPAPATLVTVVSPYPGVGSVSNPVAMNGGAAPSTPAQVQQSAPNSMLTFGLAVSPSDFEAIAAQTPSVTRARSVTSWDPVARRSAVTVYVDGGPGAVAATQAALAKSTDPNRPVAVSAATAVDLQLAFTFAYAPASTPSAVESALIAALTDPVTGPFAPSQSGIGEPLYDSQIYAACRSVPGVLSVHNLTISDVTNPDSADQPVLTGAVHSPGADSFYTVAPANVIATPEANHG